MQEGGGLGRGWPGLQGLVGLGKRAGAAEEPCKCSWCHRTEQEGTRRAAVEFREGSAGVLDPAEPPPTAPAVGTGELSSTSGRGRQRVTGGFVEQTSCGRRHLAQTCRAALRAGRCRLLMLCPLEGKMLAKVFEGNLDRAGL